MDLERELKNILNLQAYCATGEQKYLDQVKPEPLPQPKRTGSFVAAAINDGEFDLAEYADILQALTIRITRLADKKPQFQECADCLLDAEADFRAAMPKDTAPTALDRAYEAEDEAYADWRARHDEP